VESLSQTKGVDFDSYQLAAADTAVYPESGLASFRAINYCAIGVGNEAGEVLGKWKKHIRDDDGDLSDDRRDQILDEAGDVLWYLANLCSELDCSLEQVAAGNLDKLQGRKSRGTLQGSGDQR
jgi:NTP pyrophosphatase (non-canonical NTP hydrolase)